MPDPVTATPPLSVIVTHEPFIGEPFNAIFKLEYLGQSEEMDHRDALVWFKKHGASNETAVNNALNQAANFGSAEVVIAKPVFPKQPVGANAPKI